MVKKKDEIPEDIRKELDSPKFGKPSELTASGYILDINEEDKKVDIQTYEPISGTTILEGLSLSKKIKLNDLEKGVVCEFKLHELKAPLSKKTVEYLKEQEITLNEIIQYELKEMKVVDENVLNYFLESLFSNCLLNALPIIGLIKNGNVCLAHIPALTTDGTTISNLEEFAALTTAFATVSELNEIPVAFFVKFSKEGWSNRSVLTIIGLTTVRSTPVPWSSCFSPSENPSIANFVAQYDAIPGTLKLAPTDATLTIWPDFCSSIWGKKFLVQWTIPK